MNCAHCRYNRPGSTMSRCARMAIRPAGATGAIIAVVDLLSLSRLRLHLLPARGASLEISCFVWR